MNASILPRRQLDHVPTEDMARFIRAAQDVQAAITTMRAIDQTDLADQLEAALTAMADRAKAPHVQAL